MSRDSKRPATTPGRAAEARARLAAVAERAVLRNADDRPIFLGGCPRSGTTLLRTMLHSHPDLAIPRETHFVLESFWRRKEWGDLEKPRKRAALIDWLVDEKQDTRFGRLEIDPEVAKARLAACPPTLGSVIGTAFVLYAERHGASRWGDKRPLHIQQLPILYAMFPDLQFINIVRDPRAVIASMKKLGWLESWYDGTVMGAIDRWRTSVRSGQQALRRYRRDQYLEFRYEDLLADPRGHLQRICTFSGLSTDAVPTMLEFHKTDAEIPTEQASKYHPLLNQPLTTAATDKWLEQLSEDEVALIERVLADEMRRYGYEPSMGGATPSAELRTHWKTWQKKPKRRHSRALVGAVKPGKYPVAAELTTAQRRRARLAKAAPTRLLGG